MFGLFVKMRNALQSNPTRSQLISRKIFLVGIADWYLYNFRLNLAERLRELNYDVVLVCPPGKYATQLQDRGFKLIGFTQPSFKINLLSELRMLMELVALYRKERPALVHHFTIKCVLYGTIAACVTRHVRVINAITGLGHLFIDRGFKALILSRITTWLYRRLLTARGFVVFQNKDDEEFFVSRKIVDRRRSVVIVSSGVDCEQFQPVSKSSPTSSGTVQVLFASRINREKGVFELLEAVRITAEKKLNIEYTLAGVAYAGNPSTIDPDELMKMISGLPAQYVGHIDDMPSLISKSDVVVLPSYREGAPRILIEASAMAKPIIATNVPGCREVVQDNVNGRLIPPRNAPALAKAIQTLADSKELRERLGRAGRTRALNEFNQEIVVGKTIELYEQLL